MKKVIARMGICLALAYILGLFDVFKLPQGGGVSLESLPLMLFAYISGPLYGLIAGFSYGLLMITKPSAMLHPFQFILDYPLAFSSFFVLGFAGKFENKHYTLLFAALGFFIRFCFHCLSGMMFCSFFLKELPQNLPVYVAVYNLSYLLPTAFLCVIMFYWLSGRMKKLL